jgi:hypothetical protein
MSFSIDQTVIHIKLTDKGRELLSRGELRFTQFAIGDSEIDYQFNGENSLENENVAILRPVDNNPDIATFVTKTVSGGTLNALPTVVSNTSVITNTAKQRGLFDVSGGTPTIFGDPLHAKQADMQIDISTADGSRTLVIEQSPSYGSNATEPEAGDYVVVNWTNPNGVSTNNLSVSSPYPYLFYKITGITSGSLASGNLVVTVDRNIPDFEGAGSGIKAGAVLYPNNNNRAISGDSIQNYYGRPFITDFLTEAMLSFIENYDTPTVDVPVWNMTIVFTEEIAGVNPNFLGLDDYFSKNFGGFVQYVQKLDPKVKNLGIIHYTNLSPSNNYAEGLVNSNTTSPVLDLPTIMWHKKGSVNIGLTLSGDTSSKGFLPELNTEYHNLVDNNGNVVGKVLNDMKIFIIEDQELIFAMSYKSNRSWTLPNINTGLNIKLC